MKETEKVRPYRILVVDDERSQLIAMTTVIKDEFTNCEVKEAESVEMAEKILRGAALPFDLAVIDMRLNIDAEGLKLAGVIKRVMLRHSQTRIVVFTAYPTWQAAREAYESGADAFISKLDPDSTDQLRKKMRELLERRAEREELARQSETQRSAETAFDVHRAEWRAQYAGKFILVRAGQVVGAYESGQKAWEALEGTPASERLEIGIIDVREDGN
jgi:DNA-binding NtrC family response regulator